MTLGKISARKQLKTATPPVSIRNPRSVNEKKTKDSTHQASSYTYINNLLPTTCLADVLERLCWLNMQWWIYNCTAYRLKQMATYATLLKKKN